MFVYVHVCVYVCVCAHVYNVYVYVCVHVWVSVWAHSSIPVSTGAEGNVDGSLQLMKEVEEVKQKKKQVEDEYHALIPRHAVQQQKLKACEVREKLYTHVHNVQCM